jgi:hypothetical protein
MDGRSRIQDLLKNNPIQNPLYGLVVGIIDIILSIVEESSIYVYLAFTHSKYH